MADIELVIKIPEEKYQWIKEHRGRTDYQITEMLYNRIRKGTPLPDGHGRLIDTKELRQDIIAHKYSNSFCEEHHIDQSINVGMLNILIADAPTIIEADKGESEE